MPEAVEDCVDSVLADNPDYSESRAYAICKAQQEADVEDPDAVHLAEVEATAEGLDVLAAERPEWGRFESDAGVAWVGMQSGNAIYQAVESEEPDGVVIKGLSDEALADIEARYNVDVERGD